MTAALVDQVVALLERVTDRRAAAELVVTFVEMATKAELADQQRAAEERGKAERKEAERARKADYRERLSRNVPGTSGDTTGHPGTTRDLVPLGSPSGSSPISQPPDPERAIPVPPALMVFPTVGKEKTWGLPQSLRDSHEAAFPALDVMAEYRKALAYFESVPSKRKTPVGMPRCLFSWLCRAQNNGSGAKRPSLTSVPAASPMEAYCDWHKVALHTGRPAHRPRPGCPECKHLSAKARPHGETQPAELGDDPMPLWSR